MFMPRPKQTVLAPGEAHVEKPAEKPPLEKVVAFTYDNDPEVRIKAAKLLAEHKSDPLAVFGLIELVGDKDERVREVARAALNIIGGGDTGAVSSLEEIFSQKEQIIKEGRSEVTVKEKLMPSIERLFSHMSERKANRIKRQLMPSIEKLFNPRLAMQQRKPDASLLTVAQAAGMAPLAAQAAPQPPAPGSQDPLSAIERIMHGGAKAPEKKPEAAQKPPEPEGIVIAAVHPDSIPEEILSEVEKQTPIEETEEYEKASLIIDMRENVYRRALDIASTPGTTAKMLRDEEKKLLDDLKENVKLAFKLAILKAKGREIDRLVNMQPGVKNIMTGELIVSSVETRELAKGRRVQKLVRLILSDASGRMAIYLTPQRGAGIAPYEKVRLEGAYVERSPFGDEDALFISRKGKVIVIK